MSYRIHTAMGWGIEAKRFEELCKLEKNHDGIGEELYEWGKHVPTPLDFPVDKWRAIFDKRDGTPVVMGHHSSNDNTFRRLLDANESGEDLFVRAMDDDGERINHIIFFPSGHYQKKWFRWDNDLDYALLYRWRDSADLNSDPSPENRVRFVPYAPYPWTNFVMKRDGTPVKWDEPMMLQRKPWLVAAVPSEIRWYLTTLGVMDDAGVNELRPIVAEWWS